MARYFEELRKYPKATLLRAFENAWQHHDQHFPTLGQLDVACKKAAKDKPIDAPALPPPRHDHSPETMAAKDAARAYVNKVLSGEPGNAL